MKIKNVKPLNDGMNVGQAGALFDKIEAFAGYGFNKSHAIEYSVITVWTMWLRVRYPAEYFAACLSVVSEDKLPALVKDAREYGIEIFPPDINASTDRYVIVSDKKILAPFNSVLGVSDTTANRIVEMRKKVGMFKTYEEFEALAAEKGSKVNTRVVERLRLVGAFAALEAGSPGARALERRKDQTELMPGLIIDVVKTSEVTDMSDGFGKTKIVHIVQEYSRCEGCSLKEAQHPTVRIPKSKVRFMVVSDCPSYAEEKEGKLLVGDGANALKHAITENKLAVGEGYYTTLVKARKNDKFLTNEQINGCKVFLEREIEIIKPPVIVAMGAAAIKYFLSDLKGGAGDLAGKAVYLPKRGFTVVCGINPAQIAFDPSKQDLLNETFVKVAEIVL